MLECSKQEKESDGFGQLLITAELIAIVSKIAPQKLTKLA